MANCDHVGKPTTDRTEERESRFIDDEGRLHCVKTIQTTTLCECGTQLNVHAHSEECG